MVPRLQKVDAVLRDEVDKTVFLRNSAAPGSGIFMLKRLRLANARKWVSENRLYKFECFYRCLPVVFHPPREVGTKFWMENCNAPSRPVCRCSMFSHHTPKFECLTSI